MENNHPLKWTFRLLQTQKIVSIVIIILILFLVLLGAWRNTEGALFMIFFGIGYAYFIIQIQKGLIAKKQKNWVLASITSFICLPSILLPFAILSLQELFDAEKKKSYFKLPEKIEDIPYISDSKLQNNASLKTVGLICGVLVLLLLIFLKYDRIGGQQKFKIDSKLSAQELYQKGAECNSTGNLNCSLAVFSRLLEINPNDMTALANLGMVYTNTGHHEEAIKSYQVFFDRGGNALDVMAYYAQSLNALGRQNQALEVYGQVLEQYPNLIDVLENMITILSDQQLFEEALVLIENFIQKNPSAAKMLQSKRDHLIRKIKHLQETTI